MLVKLFWQVAMTCLVMKAWVHGQSVLPTSMPVTFSPTTRPTMNPSISFVPTISSKPSISPSITAMPSPRPTSRPTRVYVEPPEEEEEEDKPNVTAIVFIMLVAVLVPICCGCNRSQIIVNDFENAEQAAADFREAIMTKRRFVVTIPAMSLCGKDIPRRDYALFYSTRIKAHWKPMHTYMQMGLGWLSLATTIIALFAPSNATNNVVGFTALFMSELLTHTWYGYIRYLFKGCSGMCSRDGIDDGDDSDFEEMKILFGILYHGGHHELENAHVVDMLGFPFYAVMYLATMIAFVGTFTALCILKIAGMASDYDDDGRRRKRRNKDDEMNAEDMAGFSAFAGVMIGCFAYPLMFLVLTTPGGKVFASFMHHCLGEYYEAKLFRKKPSEFILSIVLKAFGDFVGVEDFDDNPDFQDAWNEFKENLDKQEIKDNNADKDPENPDRQYHLDRTMRDTSDTGHSGGDPIMILPAAPPLEPTPNRIPDDTLKERSKNEHEVDIAVSIPEHCFTEEPGENKPKKKKSKKKKMSYVREDRDGRRDESEATHVDANNAEEGDKKRKKAKRKKRDLPENEESEQVESKGEVAPAEEEFEIDV